MTRIRRGAALLLTIGLGALWAGSAVAVQQGPAGRAFYTPPSPLPGERHGDLIRWRRLQMSARLHAAGAANNFLILYRSTSVDGKPIAVSGTVAIPKGTPPQGGWPVISWAHGTSGGADPCAPSLDGPDHHATGDIPYTNNLLNKWVKAGYVVLRTDYEGLGTPGPHLFGIGHSEARGVIDIVRAARQLDSDIGRRWLVAGHSQGGQAALFAAADAARWAPELKLRGAIALAPLSHSSDLFRLSQSVSTPVPLTAFFAIAFPGVQHVAPQLHVVQNLSAKAKALYPDLDHKCLDQLEASDSWGGLPPDQLFKKGTDLTPLEKWAGHHVDPDRLTIPVPIQIEQGDADQTIFKSFTDQLVQELQDRGARVDYRVYKGATHHGVLAASWPTATVFAQAHLH